MASLSELLIANVAEAGDMVLYAGLLAVSLVVGLALLGIDTVVGHLHERSAQRRHGRPRNGNARGHVRPEPGDQTPG